MSTKKEHNVGVRRYFVSSNRTFSLHVIAFDKQSVVTRHFVRIMDISVCGVGVEVNERIRPGLVCFENQIGGQRFGVVAWCKKNGGSYRAGINFVTLPHQKEAAILDQIRQSSSQKTLRDPDRIIATLINTMKPEIID